jgi:hypothetical protein
VNAFTAAKSDGSNLPEFLQAGCDVAGIRLSAREAQTQAKHAVPENTP